MLPAYVYLYFGQAVRQQLPDALQTIIKHQPSLYQAGLLGPDLFLCCHRFFSDAVYETGLRLHKQPAVFFFQQALTILSELSDPEAGLAYLFGFICHFILDSEDAVHMESVTQSNKSAYNDTEFKPNRVLFKFHYSAEEYGIIAAFFPEITNKQIKRLLKTGYFIHRLSFFFKITKGQLLRRSREEIPAAVQLCENYYNTFCELDILSNRFQRTFHIHTKSCEPVSNML